MDDGEAVFRSWSKATRVLRVATWLCDAGTAIVSRLHAEPFAWWTGERPPYAWLRLRSG